MLRTRPVRLSERRGSIGIVILAIVSLGLLGAQSALGTAHAGEVAAAGAKRPG